MGFPHLPALSGDVRINVWTRVSVLAKAAMQYAMENPLVFEEKSSEGKTMLMEASSAPEPDPFKGLLEEAKKGATDICQNVD